ncbi:MAG: excalibur calcium-binding domain-containing protein [Pelagimonas sp.]|jgi:hypothetical protein|nr:excalibur calcium-binding domain-containing protein [Pelagimonas sp.]
MKRIFLCGVALMAMAACDPSVPDSAAGLPETGRGVGFDNYDTYRQNREAQLTGTAEGAAAAQAAAQNSGQAPVDASPSNPAPQIVRGNTSQISSENDFDAVSAQRDIQADAALIAQNRAQYQQVQPTDLPSRTGAGRPNIVSFALQTTNAVGVKLYKRSSFNAGNRYAKACSAFASADEAQEEFLALGGPNKDRKGMDPDGDGFACSWDPTPFRAVRGG